MTEERRKELAHQALIDLGLNYELDSTTGDERIITHLIRDVAAESRKEGIEEIRKYLRHDGNCPARSYIVYEPEKPPTCTCGLTERLKEQGDEDE